MRHTSSHTGKRRSHHNLKAKNLAVCSKCGKTKIPHFLCLNCGYYKGREVIDIFKNLNKKEKKQKEKELKETEELSRK